MEDVEPALLAMSRRGDVVEAVARGHVTVSDASGTVLASAGDPGVVTTLRSCIKPLQALPLVRRADLLGVSPPEIAVACGSHSGEPVHVQVVQRLLERCGQPETVLSCGPHLPFDEPAAHRLIAGRQPPRPIHNNCSGKHAGMIAACVAAGWPLEDYGVYGHPLQVEIRRTIGGLIHKDLDQTPRGIDGCGLPTHGLPLSDLALAFAAACSTEGFGRCGDAMASHPQMVSGTGRFDTALLAAAGGALIVKGGGAAVWVGVERRRQQALAIKLEAGSAEALPAVALAALTALGWLEKALLDHPPLSAFARPTVRNWAGTEVGETEVDPHWLSAFEAHS